MVGSILIYFTSLHSTRCCVCSVHVQMCNIQTYRNVGFYSKFTSRYLFNYETPIETFRNSRANSPVNSILLSTRFVCIVQRCSVATVSSASCMRVRRGPSRCSWRTWAMWISSRAWTTTGRVCSPLPGAYTYSYVALLVRTLTSRPLPPFPPRVFKAFWAECTSRRRRRSAGSTFQSRSSSSSSRSRKTHATHQSYPSFLHFMLVCARTFHLLCSTREVQNIFGFC